MSQYSKKLFLQDNLLSDEELIRREVDLDFNAGTISNAEKLCIDKIIEADYLNKLNDGSISENILQEYILQLKEEFSDKLIYKSISYINDKLSIFKLISVFGNDIENVICEMNQSILKYGESVLADNELWKNIHLSDKDKDMLALMQLKEIIIFIYNNKDLKNDDLLKMVSAKYNFEDEYLIDNMVALTSKLTQKDQPTTNIHEIDTFLPLLHIFFHSHILSPC